jgi:hypothetical protein
VYCKLNAEAALQRMIKRGRNGGRIDIMDNPEKQLQELNKEANCFDFWSLLLKERGTLLCTLDMRESPLEISEKLNNILYNKI